MNKTIPLPFEFAALDGKVNYVRRKNTNEYSSTCPQCGGSVHQDGVVPDRFVMLINSNVGGPFGFCRKCGFKWWEGKDDFQALDPKTMAELERQSQEYLKRREEERRLKLSHFTTGELWNELNERMQDDQRRWWASQGIPADWQDYLRLGYTPDKEYWVDEKCFHSPAYTIPYFYYDWNFQTMQYRLTANIAERYRFEAGLDTAYYMTTPSMSVHDQALVCEGAKKAMVVRILGGLGLDKVTVLAVPSQTDWRSNGILEAIEGCGRVWVLFDPDCFIPPKIHPNNWMPEPERFARAIGKNARIIELPIKVDDAFVSYGMTKHDLHAAIHQAKRIM